MPVVDVRKVGMRVNERSVGVRVRVGLRAVPGEIMLVLMMLIVPVRMLVIE
jgi:hypothetical protein